MTQQHFYTLFLSAFILLLTACNLGTGPGSHSAVGIPSPYTQSVDHYLRMAEMSPPASAEQDEYTLKAAGRMLQEGNTARSQQLLDGIDQENLPNGLRQEKTLLKAEVALRSQQPRQTINILSRLYDTANLTPYERAKYHQLRAEANAQLKEHVNSAREHLVLAQIIDNPTSQQTRYDAAWQQLSYLSIEELNQAKQSTPRGDMRGWLDIVAVSKIDANDYMLQDEISRWKTQYPDHPAHSQIQQFTPQVRGRQQIALLLPSQGSLAGAGQAVRDGFMAAYYDDTQARQNQIRFYDSSRGDIAEVYRQAVQEGATLVVGPLDKNRVQSLLNSQAMNVPTITLNYGSSASSGQVYQFGLSPLDEVQQVVQQGRRDGHRRAIIITPNSSWGNEQARSFQQKWQQGGGQVVTTLAYAPEQDLDAAVKDLLHIQASEQREQQLKESLGRSINFQPQRRQDVDMVFLAAPPQDARQIQPLLRYYYAGSIPVYATSVIYNGIPNPISDQDLNGIRFLDIPWVFNDSHEHQAHTHLYALGLDAYDLSQRLSKLNALPRSRFNGETGTLSLTSDQKIYRELTWGKFQDGRARA